MTLGLRTQNSSNFPMFDSIIYEEDRVVSEKDLSGILIRITNTHRVGVEARVEIR